MLVFPCETSPCKIGSDVLQNCDAAVRSRPAPPHIAPARPDSAKTAPFPVAPARPDSAKTAPLPVDLLSPPFRSTWRDIQYHQWSSIRLFSFRLRAVLEGPEEGGAADRERGGLGAEHDLVQQLG